MKTVTCVDLEGNTYETPVSELTWRPCVYGIVIKDRKVLLSKQFDGYDLPGGGVELGETLEEALLREVWEETGIKVAEPKLVHGTSNFYKQIPQKGGTCIQSIMLYYVCKPIGGKLSTEGFDDNEKQYADMPEWFDIEKLDTIKVSSSIDWRGTVRGIAK